MAAQLADLQRRRLQTLRLGVPTLAASANQKQASLLGLDASVFEWLQPCNDSDGCGPHPSVSPPPRLLRTLALARATSRAVLRTNEVAAINRAGAATTSTADAAISANICTNAPNASAPDGSFPPHMSTDRDTIGASASTTSQYDLKGVTTTNGIHSALPRPQNGACSGAAPSTSPANGTLGDQGCMLHPAAMQAQQQSDCTMNGKRHAATSSTTEASIVCPPAAATGIRSDESDIARCAAPEHMSCRQGVSAAAAPSAGMVVAAMKAGYTGKPAAAPGVTAACQEKGKAGGEQSTAAVDSAGGIARGNGRSGAANGMGGGLAAACRRMVPGKRTKQLRAGSAALVASVGVGAGTGAGELITREKSSHQHQFVIQAYLFMTCMLGFQIFSTWFNSKTLDRVLVWLMFVFVVLAILKLYSELFSVLRAEAAATEDAKTALPYARDSRKEQQR